jgi:hypothetical protein
MLTSKEALLGHGKMEFVGRSDADQVGSIGSQQGIQTRESLHFGIFLLAAEAISLDHSNEVQTGANFQERSMHFFSNRTIAN